MLSIAYHSLCSFLLVILTAFTAQESSPKSRPYIWLAGLAIDIAVWL